MERPAWESNPAAIQIVEAQRFCRPWGAPAPYAGRRRCRGGLQSHLKGPPQRDVDPWRVRGKLRRKTFAGAPGKSSGKGDFVDRQRDQLNCHGTQGTPSRARFKIFVVSGCETRRWPLETLPGAKSAEGQARRWSRRGHRKAMPALSKGCRLPKGLIAATKGSRIGASYGAAKSRRPRRRAGRIDLESDCLAGGPTNSSRPDGPSQPRGSSPARHPARGRD